MAAVIPVVHAVTDDLERNVERGLQVPAYRDGQPVMDSWVPPRRYANKAGEIV